MKSSAELKKELHEYIDSIDDDETLWMVHEEVVEYLKKEKITVNLEKEDLTEEEISEIKIGLDQIQNGETVDWDEYLKATSRWHTP
jgi:predicted transcriptional regulator